MLTTLTDTLVASPTVSRPGAAFPDAKLLRRYDRPGPRYTSYPTALEFSTAFGEAAYRQTLAERNAVAADAPLSLYLHIPFCTSPCFFCACNKVITRQRPKAESYLERLKLEIGRQGPLLPRNRVVQQLHLGGGTPTFLGLEQLTDLMGALDRHFSLSTKSDREFSIEIDPRTVTASALTRLPDIGFNRVSFGVQDFDPEVQAAVNRIQPAAQTLALIQAARDVGFRSVSVDLIYGLPLQTRASFGRTLDQLLTIRPDRVSAYSYAHLPHRFKPQRRIKGEQLPPPEEKLALLELTVHRLLDAGYVYIGMDHFALPDDELVSAASRGDLQRNFQGYSTHGGADLVGLGMSSISRIDGAYAQNARTLAEYDTAIDGGGLATDRGLRLTAEDLLRRDVIADLMCRGEVRFGAIGDRHEVDFESHFQAELGALRTLAADGLVTVQPDRIRVTPTGRYLLRVVAMVFDTYLGESVTPQSASDPPHYSRVV